MDIEYSQISKNSLANFGYFFLVNSVTPEYNEIHPSRTKMTCNHHSHENVLRLNYWDNGFIVCATVRIGNK